MSLLCRLKGHEPGDAPVFNRGHYFSRCRRCGADLVRSEVTQWQPVPAGYRVAWDKSAPPQPAPPAPAPAPAHAAPHSPPAPPAVPQASAEQGTILVCDDDPLIRDLLRHRLSSRGYEVLTAHDGSEAMERLAETVPDAIILDAMMPNMDGYELLRRLKEREETARIAVIMLTSRRQERDIVGALDLGADDFMVKPFIPEELLSRLGRLLSERRNGERSAAV